MKAILLAAGKGSRISKMIKEVPKSTLLVGDEPLIRLTVKMLLNNGISPVVCLGYQYREVQKALEGLPVSYYYNPFYDVTNSIGSLWFAREELDDDVIIANADVFWRQDILDIILKDPREVIMLADSSRVEVGDYFFYTEDGCIRKYGKELTLEERNCEYVGIARVQRPFLSKFNDRLVQLIKTQNHSLWWENVLYSYIDEYPVRTTDINGHFWSEIDYIDDYHKILDFITKNK